MTRWYYMIKPCLPWSVRMAVRRWLARRKLPRVAGSWPIKPGSETAPSGWTGWPAGRQFALVITHDVEGTAGLNNCRELMRMDLEMGFSPSFNFVPEGQYLVPIEMRRELYENGCEIGVHDLRHDGKLFVNRSEFQRHARRINHYLGDWDAAGFRSGFMLSEPEWLHDLHIQYDASTFDTDPFEPQPNGTHTIFPFWVEAGDSNDVPRTNGRAGTIRHGVGAQSSRVGPNKGYVELPYTLPQDSTLFLLLREQTIDVWKQKLKWIASHGGMVLINTHPDYMQMEGNPATPSQYPVSLYKSLLNHIDSEYAGAYWQPLPHELAAWYRRQRVLPKRAWEEVAQ